MSPWPSLLRRALEQFERLDIGPSEWQWGGGTVLMLRHGHRQSRDIDIFLHDVQYLSYLSPRLSEDAARGIQGYSEAANYLRLEYPEGEVDFLVVAPVFPDLAPELVELVGFDGRFQLMPDVEILGQKLHYRAAGFTGRDLYDFAAVTQSDPSLLQDAGLLSIARHRRDALAMSTQSKACQTAYEALNHPTIDIPFDAARAALLDWIEHGPTPAPASDHSPSF